MADTRNIPLTVDGNDISGEVVFAVGETVNLDLTCLIPIAGGALDLTNSAVICTITCYSVAGLLKTISRQATIATDPTTGVCTVGLVSGDTVPSTTDPIRPGRYRIDIWAEDTSGNRTILAYGECQILKAERLPNAPTTPGSPQTPLGQGIPGLGLNYVFESATYSARFLDLVVADPTAGAFNVTLPLISTLTGASGSGLVALVHGSSSTNTVGVVPSGSDKILISSALQSLYLINTGESLRLIPAVDGVRGNRWVAF